MENLVTDIKALIINTLELEDIAVEDIEDAMPLFDGGLGLDSIDALELGIALQKHYGIKLDEVTDDVKAQFSSAQSLAAFVSANRE